jgi:hypothetical protein
LLRVQQALGPRISSNATQLQQTWTRQASIGDDHIGLKDNSGQSYLPFVEIFQDKAFGGFMYREPAAQCRPFTLACGVHISANTAAGSQSRSRRRWSDPELLSTNPQ